MGPIVRSDDGWVFVPFIQLKSSAKGGSRTSRGALGEGASGGVGAGNKGGDGEGSGGAGGGDGAAGESATTAGGSVVGGSGSSTAATVSPTSLASAREIEG